MRNNEDLIIVGAVEAPVAIFRSDAEHSAIRGISYTQSVDVVGAQLSIDTATLTVNYKEDDAGVQFVGTSDYRTIRSSDGYLMTALKQHVDLKAVPYGTQVRYYRNETLVFKAYVKNIVRTGKTVYRINAISAIGLLEAQYHSGGVYSGQTFSSVLNEIIGGIVPYTVGEEVANLHIYGWLPFDTKRANLHQLLFSQGVMVGRNPDGDMHFAFLSNAKATVVPDGRIYIDGEVDYSSLASEVRVTEHAFLALSDDEEVVEYDNTDTGIAADSTLVLFQNAPLHDLSVTGNLTIEESGVNYAVVSGTGVLSGKKYLHSTKVVSAVAENAAELEQNVVSSSECALITLANSENVAARLLSFYGSRKTVRSSIVLDGEKAGDLLVMNDPYYEEITAFLSSMNANVSSNVKGDCLLITDFLPSQGGSNYTDVVIFDEDQTIDLDALIAQYPDKDNDLIQLVLIGGGHGGYSGANGRGTEGGTGGAGGEGGKVLVVTVHMADLASHTLNLTVGEGGASDSDGTATEFGDWTSADGSVLVNGYANIFTSAIYATRGNQGVSGGRSGPSGNGESVTYNGHTWAGGQGEGYTYQYTQKYRPTSTVEVTNNYSGQGGSGGGAAVGAVGGDAYPYSSRPELLGVGGDGADAVAGDDATVYGCGGQGGHGGGGAGRGGHCTVHWTSHDFITLEDDSGTDSYYRDSGMPGTGGAGGKGGNGALLIMI